MASDLNSCTFTGRLVRDPWTKEGENFLAKFTLAVNGRKDDAAFLDFTAFGGLAEKVVAVHCTKGKQVSVIARAESRQIETPEGNRYQTAFIVQDLVLGGGGGEAKPAADDPGW